MRRFVTITDIFKRKFYLAELVVGFFLYFLIFSTILQINRFVILNGLSEFLSGILILSSSILLSITTYIIRNSTKASGYAGSLYSLIASAFGSLFASCGCQATLLMTFLYTIGLNAIEASWFLNIVSSYNNYVLVFFVLVNFLLIYYYLGKAAQYTEHGKKEAMSKVFLKHIHK
ncbi:MAG: hypothetical protein ACP5RT_00490 [Candidatus Micrarchaeia archaeon]